MATIGTPLISDVTPGTFAAEKVLSLDKDSRVRGSLIHDTSDHFAIRTTNDSKNVRINSRNYPGTTGDSSGMQCKPNRSVTGSAGITGAEFSPRFAAGIAGSNLVAIKADPLLKAGSGNLSGKVAAVEANIDFGVSGTRTITGDVSAFEAFLAIPSTNTYSGLVSFMRVRTVNIRAWDSLLNLDDSATGVGEATANGMFKDPEGDTEAGFLNIHVGATKYEIPFYASS